MRWSGDVTFLRVSQLINDVPNIEEVAIRGGRHIPLRLPRGAVQRRTDILFGVVQLGEGDLKRRAVLLSIKVADNFRLVGFVLAVPSMGNIGLLYGGEIAL